MTITATATGETPSPSTMAARGVLTAVLLVFLAEAANVDIGRGVDVLQRFGIIGDVLYGDVSNAKEPVTRDILDGADRFT